MRYVRTTAASVVWPGSTASPRSRTTLPVIIRPRTARRPATTIHGVVTSDTIAVGVLAIDYDLLRDLGLVDINRGDDELVWQVFVDDINRRGGIDGRMLELHWRPYSVVNPQEQHPVDHHTLLVYLAEEPVLPSP